jgi:hypothetical protein
VQVFYRLFICIPVEIQLQEGKVEVSLTDLAGVEGVRGYGV